VCIHRQSRPPPAAALCRTARPAGAVGHGSWPSSPASTWRSRELGAGRRQPGHGGGQGVLLAGGQPGRGVDRGQAAGRRQLGQPGPGLGGQPLEAAVLAAGGEQPVDVGGGLELQPGEGPGHLLDHLDRRPPADLGTEVVQHHPAPLGVDGQRGGHVPGVELGQGAHDHALVDEQGEVGGGLEPDVAAAVGARSRHDSSQARSSRTGPVTGRPSAAMAPRSQRSASPNQPGAVQGWRAVPVGWPAGSPTTRAAGTASPLMSPIGQP
jgi:hypothetical protein